MEENILMWIQNENNEQFDYMFFHTQLLNEKKLNKIKIIRNILFNNPNSKRIWKDKEYSQSSVLKIENNYIITGVLKSRDSNNRRLPFMFYLPSEIDNLEQIIYSNLKVIGKEINPDLLKKLLSKTKNNDTQLIIILSSLLLLFVLFFDEIKKKLWRK